MNYLEAALKILEEVSRPLTHQQLAAIALERTWIEPQGSDPAGFMNLLIMQDLKTKGVRSEFSRIGPGTYTLRKLVYKSVPEILDTTPPGAHRRSRAPAGEVNGNTQAPAATGAHRRSRAPAREIDGNTQTPLATGMHRRPRTPAGKMNGNTQAISPGHHRARPRPEMPGMETPAPRHSGIHKTRPAMDETNRHERHPRPPSPPVRPERPVPPEPPAPPAPPVVPAKSVEPPRAHVQRPPASQELWQLMETLGTSMGYKIQSVLLADQRTTCMGWHIGGNPELAFILWVPEGTNMREGIANLAEMNYHKVMVMVADEAMAEAERLLADFPQKDRVDLIGLATLTAQAQAGARYMEFYNRLCDARPLRERKSFIID